MHFLVVSHDSIRGCVRPLVRRSVRRSVGPSVRPSVTTLSAGRNEDGERLMPCIRPCFIKNKRNIQLRNEHANEGDGKKETNALDAKTSSRT